jgi:hypothetical protein
MRAGQRFAVGVLAAVAVGGRLVAAQTLDRRQLERIEQTLRQEGQAIVALADAAAQGSSGPADFSLRWHNDFFKAQNGTFVPFVVSISVAAPQGKPPAALLYVRAARRAADESDGKRRPRRGADEPSAYPFEEIYPIDLAADAGNPVRIARGFSLSPGHYDLIVVVREREREDDRGRKRLAGVLRQALSVPDFSTGELMTSTVIVADRLTMLPSPGPSAQLQDRPYVVAGREIQPASDLLFRRDEELIVVFLVYNPAVRSDKHFDLEVEYHFFRNSGPGEAYFNRTEPQRFTPGSLGPQYDPSAGQPLMAGQGVPLAGFEDGDYRLAIKVTDLVSSRSLSREISFSVRSK